MSAPGDYSGTVGRAMDRPDDTPDATTIGSDAGAPERSPKRRRGRLDRRTVALCVAIALVGAIMAGLVASVVVDDEGTEVTAEGQTATLLPRGEIDPDELAAAELLAVDDTETNLGELIGAKPAVVNLWSQTCAPCLEEMPWFEQASRDNPEVAFLGVNELDRLDKAQAMATKTGITYPWVRDPVGDFANAARSTGLPHTLLVAPDGAVLASKLGSFDSPADLQRWLDDKLV